MKSIGILRRIMLLVPPTNNNRWVYTMHGLEKPMDHVSAGGVMAGSVATLAVLWVFLQTMGFFGPQNNIGAFKLPYILENHLANGKGGASWEPGQPLEFGPEATGKRLPVIDEASLNGSIEYARHSIALMERLEKNIIEAGVTPQPGTPASSQTVYHKASEDALEKALAALVALGASKQLAQTFCPESGLSDRECARLVSTLPLDNTSLGGICADEQAEDCDPDDMYRSLDGSCNNLQNPKWGSAFTAYARLLFPHYADGIQMPRRERKGRGTRGAPNPRAVSVALIGDKDRIDVSKTVAVAEWAHFVARDIAYTPSRHMVCEKTNSCRRKPITCCESDGRKPMPRYVHPHCAAISVAEDDPVYGSQGVRCLNYVRSMPVLNSGCSFGPAEQMNQVSHFLDGSTIYGSTMLRSAEIRAYQGGLLTVNSTTGREFLPVAEELQCNSGACYLTGDDRANAEPQQAVMHTIWVREHNRIARKLAEINPNWNDEVLFQEARRIVIAEIQHITYKEWLPMVIGKRFANSLGLGVAGNYSNSAYRSYQDPSVSNEVATAALRFFYSLKQGKLSMTDDNRQVNESMQLSDYFYKPQSIEKSDVFNGLVRGLATQTAQTMDLFMIPDVTHQLYKTDGSVGLDQVSFDIQRGRDHGLPGYNEYRKYCGLKTAKKFDDFLDYIPLETIKKLQSLYAHPDDVDLIIGGMAERIVDNAMVGPTFRCLVSMQFLRIRQTDRFFYDSQNQPKPFTISQLNSLKKVSLARVFCDNGDSITKMQPNVLLKLQKGNELRPCKDFEAIPSIDLFAWAEKAKAYR